MGGARSTIRSSLIPQVRGRRDWVPVTCVHTGHDFGYGMDLDAIEAWLNEP
jgi:hypothetical protein